LKGAKGVKGGKGGRGWVLHVGRLGGRREGKVRKGGRAQESYEL